MKKQKTIEGVIKIIKGEKKLIADEGKILNITNTPIGVFSGDYVSAKLLGKRQCEVTSIIHRKKQGLVGIAKHDKKLDKYYIEEPILGEKIYIYKSDTDFNINDRIFVRLTNKLNTKRIEGRAVVNLSQYPESEQINIISTLNYGVGYSFSPKVIEEAEDIVKNFNIEDEKPQRYVLGEETAVFTIDPEDAKDFDDAISVRFNPDSTVTLGVHIADVSHFVKHGSKLDKEAYKRGNSTYLVGEVIPMLPEELSNDLCSLNPNEDKLAFSVFFNIYNNFQILDYSIQETVIRSKKRFTYKEAQQILDKKEGIFLNELEYISHLSDKLKQELLESGAYEFDSNEIEIKLDQNGEPISIKPKPRLKTHKIIESLMVLANRTVAKHMSESKVPFIYRVHETPDIEKLNRFKEFVNAIGRDIKIEDGRISYYEIKKLINSIEDDIIRDIILGYFIRSMQKAYYSPKNKGHFGLAIEFYTHFTSPIRRYSDLVAHRLIKAQIFNRKYSLSEAELDKIAKHLLDREIHSMEAERMSRRQYQIRYIINNNITEFDGIVVGIEPFGIFVKDTKTFAMGLISARKYDIDINTDNKLLSATIKGHKPLTLGSKVKCKIEHINTDDGLIDLSLTSIK